MNSRYINVDDDPDGDWASDNPCGAGSDTHPKMVYAIQGPFTGELFYPPEGTHWRSEKTSMKKWLQKWGSEYEEKWIDDGNEFVDEKTGRTVKVKAIVLKDAKFSGGEPDGPQKVLAAARRAAAAKMKAKSWPKLIFTSGGEGGPRLKRYIKDIRKGKVPMSYWADDDYEDPVNIETQSWDHVNRPVFPGGSNS